MLKNNGIFIIAEAGVNHNGNFEIAKKLVDAAREAGADAIKFQTFVAEKVISKFAEKAEYQKETTGSSESQLEMVKKLELNIQEHYELIDYCKQKNIMFLSTPFDHDSIELLFNLGMRTYKIPSGEITNLPYLKHVAKLADEVILSSGMSTLSDIESALDVLVGAGVKKNCITVLHATTEYPCPKDEVNLNAMTTIKNAFKINIGYSDHTNGIEIPIASAAMGATIIEKHFTLDKNMEGPDHKASLEPHELKQMVLSIRNIEKAMGNGIKKPTKSEMKNIAIARKSLVAKKEILEGEVFTEENITVKRPGNGISPMLIDSIIGSKSLKNYSEDEVI